MARTSASRVLHEYREVSAAQRLTLEQLYEGMERGYTPSRDIQSAVGAALDQCKKMQDGLELSAQHLSPPSHLHTPSTRHPHHTSPDTSLDATPIPHETPGDRAQESPGADAKSLEKSWDASGLQGGRAAGAVAPGSGARGLQVAAGKDGEEQEQEQRKDVVALALEQARVKVEKLQHKISKAMLESHAGAAGGPGLSGSGAAAGSYQALRGLEAQLAVEQRLVYSLEAALAVCSDQDRPQHPLPRPASPSATDTPQGEGSPAGRVDVRGLDQIKQLDATIQMLVERLQHACEQPARNAQQLSDLFKDKRVLQRRVAALEKSEREALAACDRQRRQGDKATASVLRLRTENNRLRSEADKAAKQVAAAEEELDKLRKHAQDLQAQLIGRSAELEAAREREAQREQARAQERRQEAERERERERESERQRERASEGVKKKLAELQHLKQTLHHTAPPPALPQSASQVSRPAFPDLARRAPLLCPAASCRLCATHSPATTCPRAQVRFADEAQALGGAAAAGQTQDNGANGLAEAGAEAAAQAAGSATDQAASASLQPCPDAPEDMAPVLQWHRSAAVSSACASGAAASGCAKAKEHVGEETRGGNLVGGDQQVLEALYRQLEKNRRDMAAFLHASSSSSSAGACPLLAQGACLLRLAHAVSASCLCTRTRHAEKGLQP